MTVLIDTNVLLDVVRADPVWFSWSHRTLRSISASDDLAINPVVYAELSIAFANPVNLDEFLDVLPGALEEMPKAALFEAAKAHQRYRRTAGRKSGILPDFFIGAHAAIMNWPLLTRDIGRYRTYFPTVRLIAPRS